MVYAILNRLIALVNKTLKMSFFSRKLSFSQLKLGFGSMSPKKRTSLKEDSNWIDILKPCYICVCVSVCLFTSEVPFTGLFAPPSQSRMSKILKDLEYLGKSNGKKWSQIWKLLLIKGVISPRRKKVFTDFFSLHLFTFFKRLSAPTSQSPMSKLYRFGESLGKSNGKKWSQIWNLLLIKGVKLPRIFFFFWRILLY